MGQNAGYFRNKADQRYSFFLFSFKKIALKVDKMLIIYCCSTNALNLIFLNSIQNSHVHKPSKLIENLQHSHITAGKNLTSNHCLKLKNLGFSVLKLTLS